MTEDIFEKDKAKFYKYKIFVVGHVSLKDISMKYPGLDKDSVNIRASSDA